MVGRDAGHDEAVAEAEVAVQGAAIVVQRLEVGAADALEDLDAVLEAEAAADEAQRQRGLFAVVGAEPVSIDLKLGVVLLLRLSLLIRIEFGALAAVHDGDGVLAGHIGFAGGTGDADAEGFEGPSQHADLNAGAGFCSSRAPMAGALPSRTKRMEGWKPQQTMSTERCALAMAWWTAAKARSPLTSGV